MPNLRLHPFNVALIETSQQNFKEPAMAPGWSSELKNYFTLSEQSLSSDSRIFLHSGLFSLMVISWPQISMGLRLTASTAFELSTKLTQIISWKHLMNLKRKKVAICCQWLIHFKPRSNFNRVEFISIEDSNGTRYSLFRASLRNILNSTKAPNTT